MKGLNDEMKTKYNFSLTTSYPIHYQKLRRMHYLLLFVTEEGIILLHSLTYEDKQRNKIAHYYNTVIYYNGLFSNFQELQNYDFLFTLKTIVLLFHEMTLMRNISNKTSTYELYLNFKLLYHDLSFMLLLCPYNVFTTSY